VHEVGHHIGALAVDLFFAGLVEVKLNELVAFALHRYETTRRIVDLDSVPIVDDLERRRLVLERDGGQSALLGDAVADVDGRLQFAQSARAVVSSSAAHCAGPVSPE
jgi:hypothetical protein